MLEPLRGATGEPSTHEDARGALASTAEPIIERGGFRAAFAGRPRTERGLAAWLEQFAREGPAAFDAVGGHFVVAIAEPDGALILAGDRTGASPLWYQHIDGAIAFASDPRCLDRHPSNRAAVDPQSLYHYVYFGVVPGPASIKLGRSRLLPGEFLRIRDGQIARDRYWELAYDESSRDSADDLEAELWRVLRAAVRSDCDAGGRVGAFLSGGVDSSTIAGLLAECSDRKAPCYTIGFDEPGYNELGFARTAAEHFGVEHRSYMVTPGDVLEAIPTIAEAYGEPFGNESAVPTYFCARFAREDGVDSLLAGDGGDELFAGNERYATQGIFEAWGALPGSLRSLVSGVVHGFPLGERIWPVRKARSYIRQANIPLPARLDVYSHVEQAGAEAMFAPEFLARIDRGGPGKVNQAEWDRSAGCSTLNRMLHLDMKLTLADNDLRKVTRMCEIAGTEVRYPFLDDRVVAFSAKVPSRLKLKGRRLRYFFKHAMRDFLPRDTLTKTKHGFGLPFGVWLQKDPALQEFATERLEALRDRGIFRAEYIDRVEQAHRTEHAVYYGVAIWGLMMLEQWFRAHVDGRAPQEVR